MANRDWTEEKLLALYPRLQENPRFYLDRIRGVEDGFADSFDTKQPPRLFSAPGRTEIGGNHTDHQHGCVLAAAVDLDILGAALQNDSQTIRVLSEGFPMDEIDLRDTSIKKDEENTSAALIRGTAAKLMEMGYPIGGFDLYATSNVLKGSGLSSSAAYEMLLGTVMNGLFCQGTLSPVALARIGQYAENVYFGKMSGLMDQTASAVGGMVAIDFLDNTAPRVEKLFVNLGQSGYALCIIDSGADHADLSPQYSAIPQEMKAVAEMLGGKVLRETTYEAFQAQLPEIRKQVGDRAVLRALHFYRENQRAQEEAKAILAGDFQKFLSLVRASGASSLAYLQNVTVEGRVQHQEVLYALAACDMLLEGEGAFRVHGGGFAGTVQAFVPFHKVDGFKKEIERWVGAGCCHILSIREAGGVELER